MLNNLYKTLIILFTLSVSANSFSYTFPDEVFRGGKLGEAVKKAKAEKKPVVIIYTEENSDCPLCEEDNEDIFKKFKKIAVCVYVNSESDAPEEWDELPDLITDTLNSKEAGETIPITAVFDPFLTEKFSVIANDDEKLFKKKIKEVTKNIDKLVSQSMARNYTKLAINLDNKRKPRAWLSKDKKKLKAKLLQMKNGTVLLKTKKAKVIEIDFSKLSKKDQAYLIKLAKYSLKSVTKEN